jgi:2-C-methyl-D-erythritol 4-phosphate cytidylyltransferase / 2-C-methyl-D-erythritol 2,4-cyclodiphosphate synthase
MSNVESGGLTAALIVAGGSGIRAGPGGAAKQYRMIGDRPVLAYCLDTFLNHPAIAFVQVVIGANDARAYRALAPDHEKLRPPVVGADSRQGSVMAGLISYRDVPPANILIHDGVRPFASAELITRVADALDGAEAVVPTLPVTATLKEVDVGNRVIGTVPRTALYTAETPQGFRYAAILEAHIRAASNAVAFTDDAAIAEWRGLAVHSVPGEAGNVKLTTAADIAEADRRILGERMLRLGDVRIGTGYDVHALGPGNEVMLGGIAIPHTGALIGHSDADVGLHALTDAILGALADGDIGSHFPPSDPHWKGCASERFLADAARRVADRGGIIAHLDLTLIAEAPKISKYRDVMRQRIADICGLDIGRVSVKATTNERLGFVGRGEGIAAQATATIRLPAGDAQ